MHFPDALSRRRGAGGGIKGVVSQLEGSKVKENGVTFQRKFSSTLIKGRKIKKAVLIESLGLNRRKSESRFSGAFFCFLAPLVKAFAVS